MKRIIRDKFEGLVMSCKGCGEKILAGNKSRKYCPECQMNPRNRKDQIEYGMDIA